MNPCWDLLPARGVGGERPHSHPSSVMQKSPSLERLWMQREVLTQLSRLPAAVTSSCPQPRRCQTEEEHASHTSKVQERRDARCHASPVALQ